MSDDNAKNEKLRAAEAMLTARLIEIMVDNLQVASAGEASAEPVIRGIPAAAGAMMDELCDGPGRAAIRRLTSKSLRRRARQVKEQAPPSLGADVSGLPVNASHHWQAWIGAE